MFLMFHLQRPDVLPVGDLGIRKAFQSLYGLPELPEAAEMERIAEPWRPHRSLACLFLWRSASAVPV
jgi:DNA-3-methyladenine glycosylase II